MSVDYRPELLELPSVKDRLTFLYVERCKLTCKNSSLALFSAEQKGTVYIPVSRFLVLFLGRGVDITSDAILLLGDAGVTVCWVGEQGVRFYACGKPLTESSAYLEAQVKHWTDTRLRLQVARSMFGYRFPEEDVSKLYLRELRLKEASRVKALYKVQSELYGISFRRDYDVNNFEGSDSVNQALSASNVCLYGLCHAVIVALGMSPSLGFVHHGHVLSFVYDVADLYKHEITIPLSFRLGSQNVPDIGNVIRRECRDIFYNTKLIKRIVSDLRKLFDLEDKEEAVVVSSVDLWE